MIRGRPRKHDPSIPAHIDQASIPRGLHWDRRYNGTWYVLEFKPNGKRGRTNVARPDALLSDLHRIAEVRAGGIDRDTLQGLVNAFQTSEQCKALSASTRTDYDYCAAVVLAHPTKTGRPFGELHTRRIPQPLIQRLVDSIASGTQRDAAGQLVATPSKAAHVQRFLRRLFRWGINRGFCDTNPADGVELPTERKQRRLPDPAALEDVIAFARAHAGTRGKQDSCAPYLWAVIEIAYACRLRGIEVCDLNDACATDEGILCDRRKGSRSNVVAWSPRLRDAWDALIAYRNQRWAKHRYPTPLLAEHRSLLVSMTGDKLSRASVKSAWQRMILLAIEKGVLTKAQRFGGHDLKRRGITDTPGTRGEKQLASGHRSEQMLDVYDHSVPLVQPATLRTIRPKP